jgi:hypothetical protein
LKLFRRLLGREPLRVTEDERNVARYLLAGDDPRFTLLAEQLDYAPVRRSNPNPTGFAVSPEYTRHDLRFPFELVRLDSPWVQFRDQLTGMALEFRVSVVRGGFLNALEGRTTDGQPWPARWLPDLSRPIDERERLQLPSAEAIEAERRVARQGLERWLGRAIPRDLDTFPPASQAQIAARETSMGWHFPEGLKRLYLITDGLESNDFRFLGHADAYTVDSPYLPALLLAWDSDDRDDFVVVVSLDGSDEAVYRLDVHVNVPEPEVIGRDVREYLASRIPAGRPA